MLTITLNNGQQFNVDFAGPVAITENVVFLAKILDSTVDEVHNAFKKATNISVIKLGLVEKIDEGEGDAEFKETELAVYTGYVVYCGFNVEPDGSILVRLKKNVG